MRSIMPGRAHSPVVSPRVATMSPRYVSRKACTAATAVTATRCAPVKRTPPPPPLCVDTHRTPHNTHGAHMHVPLSLSLCVCVYSGVCHPPPTWIHPHSLQAHRSLCCVVLSLSLSLSVSPSSAPARALCVLLGVAPPQRGVLTHRAGLCVCVRERQTHTYIHTWRMEGDVECVIGTRSSVLARAQATEFQEALRDAYPALSSSLCDISTEADTSHAEVCVCV